MINIRGVLVGFFTGVLLVLGWVVYIDGQTTSADGFVAITIAPALLTTFAAIMINLVSATQVAKNHSVQIWLFIWFTLQAVCVGWAIYIITVVYTPEDNYGGVVVLLQTVIVMMAGILFFIGRQKC